MTHPGEQHYPDGITWHAPMPRMTLPDLLDASAQKFSDRVALEFRDRSYSFPDLKAKADTAAAAFLRAGFGRDASIALFLGNTPDHPVSFFGALRAGARVVHLSALDGRDRAGAQIDWTQGARILVTSEPRHAAADGAEISRARPARSPDRLHRHRLGGCWQRDAAAAGRSADRDVARFCRRCPAARRMAHHPGR